MIGSRTRGDRGGDASTSCRSGETLEIWRTRVTNHRAEPARAVAVQRGRVLPLGRVGRRDQLQRNFSTGEVRGDGRRHLPHDRVPRAAEPFRLLRLLGRRWPGSTRSGRRSSARTAAGTGRSVVEHGRSGTRSRTAGRRSARTRCELELAPGETREVVFVLGYAENPPDAKFDPPGSRTIDKRRASGR